MDREDMEKLQQKKESEMFNSNTKSRKVRNQNQTHNAKDEGIGPINNKY